MSFGGDLEKFGIKTKAEGERVMRKSAFDLFASVIYQTPIDKGVLRNNWFATIGKPSTETTDESDKIGNGTVARMESVVNAADWENTVFMTNNLPYSIPIEYDGWSAQAPQGMVRINTARWDSIVMNNAKALASGD